mgnify:CR=1 FL=1
MNLEEKLGQILKAKNLTVATAESCTGGLVSSKLTDVSGSSDYVKLNFVTYSNESKNEILGVSWDILNNFGAVSQECSYAMAEGLNKRTNCDLAICTTGIAGPTGGTQEKPVGLCYISIYYKKIITVKEIKIDSATPRVQMKECFANEALKLAISIVEENRIS